MKEFIYKYREYQITGGFIKGESRPIPLHIYEYNVYSNGKHLFSFLFAVVIPWSWHRFPDEKTRPDLIRKEGFDLACGLIDTEKYNESKKYKSEIVDEFPRFNAQRYELPKESEIADDVKIRFEILKALCKIRRENPESFETAEFNEDGFCKVLRISKADFSYAIGCLEEEGLINIKNDKKSITIKGVREVEQGNYKYRIIDHITSEIQKSVHNRLNEINPDIFNRLVNIKQQLIEEKKDFKWQQVAFECRDIIQDFTHYLYRPEYLLEGEKAPKKSETKRKLKFILQNRLNNSENTERELLEGLIEYLYKYFDCLNELIQKGVHEDIEKPNAQRCLIYTYLFIGDVLRLTKI
ncbi:hypothetical protein CEE39_00865 [bacterium (candidate division B38) B3_B38]|nr:MAG: hypothetical protein CEE39_00865 [bacterium (candidate division B38) B3_B38]